MNTIENLNELFFFRSNREKKAEYQRKSVERLTALKKNMHI